MELNAQTSGAYEVRDGSFNLASMPIRIQLEGRPETALDFRNRNERAYNLNNLQGTFSTDVSSSDGMAVVRETFTDDQGGYVAVRFRIKNTGEEEIHLQNVKPLVVEGQENLLVNGKGADAWRIFRAPIQKSDIPGCFRPSLQDKDYADAIFSSLGAVAGQGIVDTDVDMTLRDVESGPFSIIADDNSKSAPRLLVGILGQSNHLGDMRFRFSESGEQLHSLEVNYEFDGILLEAGDSIDTHWLIFYTGTNEPDMLAEYAELLCDEYNHPKPKPPLALYCDWYFYTINVTQKHMEEEIAAIKENPIPIEAFVIDNGWMDQFGTYDANEKFPDGMAHLAELMEEAAMMPGIWTCPALIDKTSPYLEKYPDLVTYNKDGKALEFVSADATCYLIDPSAPSAAAYYSEVYGKIKGWGYRYYKLDYLRSVMEHKDVAYHNPKFNRAMAYRAMLTHVRNALGEDCYICGCGGITDAANLGLIDAYRTSKDVRNQWEGPGGDRTNGALVQIKQNLFRNYTNRFWNSDPDSTLIRLSDKPFFENEVKRIGIYMSEGYYSDEEARTILTHQYLTGGNVCVSERLPDLQDSRQELLRHVIPVHGGPARIVDFDRPVCPTIFLTEITPVCESLGNWWTLALGNWEEEPEIRTIKLRDILLGTDAETFAVFEFHTQQFLGVKSLDDEIEMDVPVHGMRVLRVVPFDGIKPVLLGTDLHITGGGCEIVSCEITDAEIKGSISTRWNYPVKLFFALPKGGKDLEVMEITVAAGESGFAENTSIKEEAHVLQR